MQITVDEAAADEMAATLRYILPYLRELDRIETASNRGNPTGAKNAQICINNVRNVLAKIGEVSA